MGLLSGLDHRPGDATAGHDPADSASAGRFQTKPGRVRPIVVVLADNAGAETTDFIVPYGILKESGAADVRTVSMRAGPVRLVPALRILADQTAAAFDAAVPEGADIVIVPAMARPRSAALIAWVRGQAARGAAILSICEGVRVVAAAGLLDGAQATTHWGALRTMAKTYPGVSWVANRRYVASGDVMTTAGVTASIPASLALVDLIAGRDAAMQTAQRLGQRNWSAEHRSDQFCFTVRDIVAALGRLLAVWRHERIEVPLVAEIDEISLALHADAWSRTCRSSVRAIAAGVESVRTRRGLWVLAERPHPRGLRRPPPQGPAARVLDAVLGEIAGRYGRGVAHLVAMQLEDLQGAQLYR